MRLTEERISQILIEELTKSEVNSMIANKIDSNMNSNDFKKIVKQISADVISNLFKNLWQRDSFWKSSVSR